MNEKEIRKRKKEVENFWNSMSQEKKDGIAKEEREGMEKLDRSIRGDDIKPEHFEAICDSMINDLKMVKGLVKVIEKSPKRDKKYENTYRLGFGKLIHHLSVELKIAQWFGTGDTDGAIKVVDMNKEIKG